MNQNPNQAPALSCADVEVLLADYIDQLLLDRDASQVKAHLAVCPACAELAADAAAAVDFMERSAEVEAPPELVNKILFDIGHRAPVKAPLSERLFGSWLRPVLQPRFAMGMAMTMLSLGMLFTASRTQQWNPVDLYASAEDRAVRMWDRGVKYYQNLKIVFELQSRYQEWAQQQGPAPQPDAQPQQQNATQPAQQNPNTPEQQ